MFGVRLIMNFNNIKYQTCVRVYTRFRSQISYQVRSDMKIEDQTVHVTDQPRSQVWHQIWRQINHGDIEAWVMKIM